MVNNLTNKLGFWYTNTKRFLPWRDSINPYNIWLSEIIMQQTRVEQGTDYYLKIINRYPEIKNLAEASEHDILKMWEGLGYYSRARNLLFTARHIVNELNGQFPNSYEHLLKLKGIGPYTAAAIASIAFNQAVPAIDGNVLRVSARLFLITDPIDKISTRNKIQTILNGFVPKENPGDFNQAMMELGAIICKPKKPSCPNCPINMHCLAFAESKQHLVPVKSGKVKVKPVFFNYLVPDLDGKTPVKKNRDGIWTGLYGFPMVKSEVRLMEKNEVINIINELGYRSVNGLKNSEIVVHLLSHRRINARFWQFKARLEKNPDGFKIVGFDKLNKLAFPKLLVNFIDSR